MLSRPGRPTRLFLFDRRCLIVQSRYVHQVSIIVLDHPDPGLAVAQAGGQAKGGNGVDGRLLQGVDIAPHILPGRGELQYRVDHKLTGSVIGDIAAPLHLDDRDLSRAQHIGAFLAPATQGKDMRVFHHEQGVDRLRPLQLLGQFPGKGLLEFPGLPVVHETQVREGYLGRVDGGCDGGPDSGRSG